jgi:hypothetical protein
VLDLQIAPCRQSRVVGEEAGASLDSDIHPEVAAEEQIMPGAGLVEVKIVGSVEEGAHRFEPVHVELTVDKGVQIEL